MATNTYRYTFGAYDEIAFRSRNDMNLAVWEGKGLLRLYSYNYDDPFRERVGRFLHTGLTHLWKTKKLTDLEVIIGEKVFKCHTLIMACASQYFEEKLTADDSEVKTIRLDENFVSAKVFECLLELLYDGKDTVQEDNIYDFMKAATHLQMHALEFRIVDLLSRKVTERTCMKIWDWAELNNVQTLASKAKGVALGHFQVLRHTEEFLQMPFERLDMMLGHEQLQYRYEDDLLEGILDWVEFDPENRKQYLNELLPFVCFPFLSTRYLNELRKHPLIGVRSDFATYIDDALTYHLLSLQKDSKKLQMDILRNQAKFLKRLMPGVRRVMVMLGGEVVQDEPTTNAVACCLDMIHPYGRPNDVLQFSIASMPQPIGLQFGSSVWKQDIYVSGGTRAPTSLLVFKPFENCWHILKSLPLGRENHAMVAMNGKLYLLGGRTWSDDSYKVLSEISEYNVETDTWTDIGDLPVAVEAAPAVTVFDKIYIFGGRDTTGQCMSVIQCLDMKTGQRGIIGELPTGVEGARAIVVGKDIILVCPDGNIYKISENSQKKQNIEDSFMGDEQMFSVKLASQLSCEDEDAGSEKGEKTTLEDGLDDKSDSEQYSSQEKEGKIEKDTELEEDKMEEEEGGQETGEDDKKESQKQENEGEKQNGQEAEGCTTEAGEEDKKESRKQENEEEKQKGEAEGCTTEAEKQGTEEGEKDAEGEFQDELSPKLTQLVPSEQPISSITVVKLATMKRRQNFGLFIRKVDVMVIGGQSEDGNFLDDMLRIHVRSGQINKPETKLVIPLSGMQVECTSMPQQFLMQFFDAASCFYGD